MLAPAVVCLSAALAQEPVEAPAPAPAAEPLADRFVWEQRARLPSGLGAVAVAVTPGGDWLVLDEEGNLHRSDDKGSTWSRELAGEGAGEEAPDDEAVLLEAEAIRDEEIGSLEVEEEVEEVEEVDGVEIVTIDTSEVEAALEDVRTEVEARLADRAADEGVAGAVWVHPTASSLVLVGRADGTWRSEDGGRSWAVVSSRGGTSFTAFGEGLFAGTGEGISYSIDGGRTWVDVEGAAGGGAVSQVVAESGWLWAAGEGGLWKSRDGLRWSVAEGIGAARVLAVVPDPAWPGGFWVATPTGLLRSDDGGRSFFPSGRQPLTDLRRLVHLGLAGHLLAITGDGAWESVDGGVRWFPAARLLTDPDLRDVAFDGGLPVVAARTGVWRMAAPPVLEGIGRRTELMPLYDAVRAAQNRTGLEVEPLSLARASRLALFTPRLAMTLRSEWEGNRDVDYLAFSNTEDHDADWRFTANLCWGRCTSTEIDYDPDDVSIDEAVYEEDLYVMDGEVFTEEQVVSAAANVAQSIRAYRTHLAQVVTDAWIARQRLAQEAGQVNTLPLQAQVDHALKELELDARLDVYTEGAWRSALSTTQEVR
ncbi:MAG: hypothetical protein ACOZNI_14805 [Myxococcota bacterium]